MPDRERKHQESTFFLAARIQSIRYALAGLRVLLHGQHNARIHAAATIAVVIAALVVRISPLEWSLLVVAIGMVWAMEALNTAIELLADEISLELRPRIGKAKDVAAFGVLAAGIAAMLIGLFIFLPRLFA
jgi:diacylglycerol kinase (ATP)